jgi:integrase
MLSEVDSESVRKLARAASRNQYGWVEAFGTRVKYWRGHYYAYVRQTDGGEKRVHKTKNLGLCAKVKKSSAEDALRRVIKEVTNSGAVSDDMTLRWFWEKRFRPMREPTWKESARSRMVGTIENYIIKPFGDVPVAQIGRFILQDHLNKMAEKFSGSICQKFRTWTKAILEEAVEQDLLDKNPARKLMMPRTRKSCTRVIAPDEIERIMAALPMPERLIVRMFLVLALRPGELFALRRDDYSPGRLRIDESISPDQLLGEPKTEGSSAWVALPNRIEAELTFWLDTQDYTDLQSYIFPTTTGTPMNVSNFLNRALKPACERALQAMRDAGEEIPPGFLEGVNHQAFRRTCATQMQSTGSVKDIQAHLRHASPNITAGIYMQPIAASVRGAVNDLDFAMFPPVAKRAKKREQPNPVEQTLNKDSDLSQLTHRKHGAGDGNRTRDQQLGRL